MPVKVISVINYIVNYTNCKGGRRESDYLQEGQRDRQTQRATAFLQFALELLLPVLQILRLVYASARGK